jgi:ubiquinone/menaquinone biosynthesis C-methylase UbiE
MESSGKFTGKASIYKKHRPNYPDEYIDYLAEYNSLGPQSVIADIGSGTGILSKRLLEKGFRVVCVEPNGDMRSAAETELKDYPGFTSINGTAEHTGLAGKSADLITAAQAFHWFDKDLFKAECRRVLKDGANVALVWNSREESSPFVRENSEIMKRFCPLFKGFSGGIDEDPDMFEAFFRDGSFDHRVFKNDLRYDLNGFIGRTLSASYAPGEGSPDYKGFITALTELFEKYSSEGEVVMQNITRSYIGRV